MLPKLNREDRQFWISWSLLTGAGSVAGLLLLTIVTRALVTTIASQDNGSGSLTLPFMVLSTLSYAIPGGLIGFGQWFELRNQLPRAGYWILVTAVGWVIGFGVTVVIFFSFPQFSPQDLLILRMSSIGLASGIGQWLYLRRYWKSSIAWVGVALLTAIIGGLGWGIAGGIGGSIAWMIAGAISGFFMIVIRDRSLMA